MKAHSCSRKLCLVPVTVAFACLCKHLFALCCVWLEASIKMWCPLGEELLDEGYDAGEVRLGKVVSFLYEQDLTCVEDFCGACICVHKCACRV